ncbi:MAG: NosD domain-containing protein [Nanoarchaeota archaeon]|nr:NosD domain-containing protein [Nanoarchaeota archaeon]
MKKILLLLFIILLSNSGLGKECLTVSEGLKIDDNTLLCRDTYFITTSIEIIKDNITIDCNNAEIIGNKENAGIKIESREGLIVKNCNISNFETGISIKDSKGIELINNIISNNINGVFIINSQNYSLEENIYLNNIKDVFNVSYATEKEPIQQPEQQIITEFQIQLEHESNQLFSELKQSFEKYINTSNDNILINRTIIYNATDNSTTIRISITPKITAINYSYYEKIPKCMAIYAKEIVFKDTNYEVIVDDPVIRWNFAEPLVQEEIISYKIKKMLSEDCKKLLKGFGFATEFKEEKGYTSIILGILITISTIAVVLYVRRIKK